MAWIGIGNTLWRRRGGGASTLPAPANVTAVVDSDTQITVSWDAVTGATSYKVYYGTDGVTFGSSVTSATNSKAVTGLTAGTLYYFYVVAVKGINEGTASSIIYKYTTIANIISSNTIAWYDASDASTISLSGSDITAWADKLGGGADVLLAGLGYPVVTAEGIYCNKTLSAGFAKNWADKNQPVSIYMLVKITDVENLCYIIGSATAGTNDIKYLTATQRLTMTSDNGTTNIETSFTQIGDFVLIRAVFNGASSSIQVNSAIKATGNVNSNAAAYFCISRRHDTFRTTGAVWKDIIIRSVADSEANYEAIGRYLWYKNGFFLI